MISASREQTLRSAFQPQISTMFTIFCPQGPRLLLTPTCMWSVFQPQLSTMFTIIRPQGPRMLLTPTCGWPVRFSFPQFPRLLIALRTLELNDSHDSPIINHGSWNPVLYTAVIRNEFRGDPEESDLITMGLKTHDSLTSIVQGNQGYQLSRSCANQRKERRPRGGQG